MAYFEINGFDELEKQLERLKQSAEDLAEQEEIPFSDLFTTEFMLSNTSFASFDEFLNAGGFHAETNEEFEAIPEDAFDKHVVATTDFDSWEDMLGAATQEYISQKLGF